MNPTRYTSIAHQQPMFIGCCKRLPWGVAVRAAAAGVAGRFVMKP